MRITILNYICIALLLGGISDAIAATFGEYKQHIIDINTQCISEVSAKQVIERVLKDFPPGKDALLSFERSPEYYLAAPTLKASQPYLKASPEQQFLWLERFLKETRKYYDHPATKPWSIRYQSAYFLKDGELDATMYKTFPKKKGICITALYLDSPNSACFENQRLEIGFGFESGGKNNSAVLASIGLTPDSCTDNVSRQK